MPPNWLWRRRKWIRRRLDPLISPGFGYSIRRVVVPSKIIEGSAWMDDRW